MIAAYYHQRDRILVPQSLLNLLYVNRQRKHSMPFKVTSQNLHPDTRIFLLSAEPEQKRNTGLHAHLVKILPLLALKTTYIGKC